MYVGDDEPYRPLLELWVADDFIIHFGLYDPRDSIPPVSDDLRHKLLEAPPGARPGRLRVNDPDWADAIRRALPMLEVVAGPTPELEAPLDHLISSIEADTGPASFFAEGVSADDLGAFFDAAATLYRVAPWSLLDDDELIEVDIPELDVHRACLSVIGALEKNFGILLFDSIADYERMLDAAEEFETTGQLTELDMAMTSLSYERGADLPEPMRREVQRHGWPVASATAYPVADRRDDSDLARGVTARELRIITACTEALSSLFGREESAIVGADGRMALSYVYESGVESGVKVHLRAPPGGSRGAHVDDDPTGRRALDEALLLRMFDYGSRRWGRRFMGRLQRMFRGEFEEQLVLPVGAYHMDAEDGRTLAEHFLEDPLNELDPAERHILDAQRSAWLSLWEVTTLYPGEGMELHDLLTGEVRRVVDRNAARSLRQRAVLLARVVKVEGEYVLSGVHPTVLPPLAASDLVGRMHKYLRRKSGVAPERLREPKTVRYLIRCWLDEVYAIEEAQAIAPELRNLDGDLIIGTVDRYGFDAATRRSIERALLDVEGLHPDEPGHYVVLRQHPRQNTVIGSVRLEKQSMRLETNSVERANLLRERVEEACAGLITHRGRSHENVLAALDRPGAPSEQPAGLSPEQLDYLLQDHKRQHYEDWLDQAIPALGNRTPREAARTKSGRSRVAALISEIEYLEASLPPGQRFDVSVLREILKL